ncbi:MAG: aromatic amino acid transport family protein [Candidatus Jacksonbacteria bacterium]
MNWSVCKKFIQAQVIFAGTVIGVGLFGLPYAASQLGFWPLVIYFALLAPIVVIVHFLLGEIACGTLKLARVPGYAGEYLGRRMKKISFVVSALGILGALLAYLIVGGQFFYAVLSPFFGGSPLVYTLVFFSIGALLIYKGVKSISYIELVLFVIFIFILGLFFYSALPFFNVHNFSSINLQFLILPYGVVIFSLWGTSVIPEIKEILSGDSRLLRWVIASGSILIALVYLFFVIIILGVTGSGTSREAILGFASLVGQKVVFWGFCFGLITTFTSFLTLGLTLKRIFNYDFKINQRLSWAIACFTPLVLFIIGFNNFIDVIGLTGAIALGAEGVIIVFIYRAYLSRKGVKMPLWLYSLVIFLIFGILAEFFVFFSR